MELNELKSVLFKDTPDANDKAFRGQFERFLLPAAVGLKGLTLGGASEIDGFYLQLYKDLNLIQPVITSDPAVIRRRQDALSGLLKVYGFSKPFIDNVLASGICANDSLFQALLVVRTTKLFFDGYTGAGCTRHMKKMAKTARGLEKPAKHKPRKK
jgi:hypothetical protein